MAGGQIRLTPDQLRSRAKEYKNQASVVNGVISKMDSLLKQLESEWEGEASKSYSAQYMELKPGFVKMEDLIIKIAEKLEHNANVLQETDENLSR